MRTIGVTRWALVTGLAAAIALLSTVSGGRATGAPAGCLGALPGAAPAVRPAPPLRFGISPGVQTGQVGPLPAPARADVPARTLAALRALRPRRGRFVVRVTRLLWADGRAGIRRAIALARRYGRAGLGVELQVRYHPPAGHDGDTAGFARFVRAVVDAVAPNRHVIALQVTNEVNFAISADSSDGAYRNADAALVRGVIAAHGEARRRRLARLAIGFNWFYRSDPVTEQRFWTYLRDHGGRALARAVSWVGLDAYPGTFFPPVETPGGYRDAVLNALSTLRCYMRVAGLGARVPIRVEENGYPTDPPVRSYAAQADALRQLVAAFVRYRGTYHVTDYRWFDLRDANSGSPNFQEQYGLLRDDYSHKPAFAAYRALVRRYDARRR